MLPDGDLRIVLHLVHAVLNFDYWGSVHIEETVRLFHSPDLRRLRLC